MSNFARDGENANSALLVNISIEDFYKESPLDGMYFPKFVVVLFSRKSDRKSVV